MQVTLYVVRPPDDFRLGTVAACAFGNTTGIPIVLLSVLQQSLSRSVFAELADPLLFLSLQLLTFPLLQWLIGLMLFERESFVARLLSGRPMVDPYDPPLVQIMAESERTTRGMPRRGGNTAVSNSYISMISVGEDYLSHSYISSTSSVGERLYMLVQQVGRDVVDYRQTCSRLGAACRSVLRSLARLLKRIFVPPVLGVSAGMLLGLLGRPLVRR